MPQYLQRKQFNNEHPEQRKIRKAAVLDDFKLEIDLKGLRASQQEEKVKRLDSEMETLFKERSSSSAAKTCGKHRLRKMKRSPIKDG